MREQALKFLELEKKNDSSLDDGVHNKVDIKPVGTTPEQDSLKIIANGMDFFMGFTYCQTLLCKSWLEASSKLAKKIQAEKENSEIPSAYVEVHEEVFTNLFKSPEYASNLGRMINASMTMMKNWKILAQNSSESNDNNFSDKRV